MVCNETRADPGDDGSAKSTTLASRTREPGSIGVTPVAGADAYARQEGYSQKVLEHMSKARAGTTRAVYASKWAIFVSCGASDVPAVLWAGTRILLPVATRTLAHPLPEPLDRDKAKHIFGAENLACLRRDRLTACPTRIVL